MGHAESVAPKRPKVNTLISLLVVGLLLGIQAVSAYYCMFSTFAPQDDEGHVMAPIDQVCRGKVLGDEVYSNFGPAYVFTYAGFFWLTGQQVNHDAMRLITLGLWLLVTVVCWFTCYRITRRAVVSLMVCYTAFCCAQAPFVCEPGHPQEIIMLGLALVPAAAAVLLPARKGWFSFLAGALVGYVLMCKVNAGLFGLGGLAVALVAATEGAVARALKWLLVVAAVSAPALFILRHLDSEAGSRLAEVATLAFAAVLAQVAVRKSNGFALTDWGWAALGCLGAVAAACGAALLSGTSVEALSGIIFRNAIRHVEAHFTTLTLTKGTLILSVVSCAASLIAAFSAGFGKWRRASSALQWTTRLLLVAGVIGHLTSFSVFPILYDDLVSIYEFALPLLWIGLVPVASQIRFRERVVRNLSVLIAVFHGLVVYPVSGTQVALACLLFMPVWGFALHDTLVGLAAILPARAATRILGGLAASVVALAVLIDGACYLRHVADTRQKEILLALPGAACLRLSEPQVAAYRFLAANLNRPGRTFLTMPGMYSLYFWAQKTPPTGLNAADWMVMLSDRQQQRVVESIENHEDLWAVRWQKEAVRRVGQQGFEDKPLVQFILSDCRRVNGVAGVELRNRGGKGSSELVQCVHWRVLEEKTPQGSLQLVCRMPIALGHLGPPVAFTFVDRSGVNRVFRMAANACPLAAVAVVDLLTGRIVASSHPPTDREGEVALLLPEEVPGQTRALMRFPPVIFPEGRELCFTARIPRDPASDTLAVAIRRERDGRWVNQGLVAARLVGPNGEVLDSIPFLADADLAEIPQPRPLRCWEAPE